MFLFYVSRQALFCSLIQIQFFCSEQTMSTSGMKTVCWLEEHWSNSSKDWENIWTQKIARAWNRSNRTVGWNIKFWPMREDRQGLSVHACCFLVCRLAPILLDLLFMLQVTGYIRLGLECITSVYQQNGVFPHCLPPIRHWKSFSFTLN
jgi:hypothetical protein